MKESSKNKSINIAEDFLKMLKNAQMSIEVYLSGRKEFKEVIINQLLGKIYLFVH
jgi:hypothetical protein